MLDKIFAPYNFVPLSDNVFKPDWQTSVSQDIPLEDGYCGILDFTIEAQTPVLPGQKNEKNNQIEHFVLPDDHLAIPGATLRGMIRNVLEIAAFGKMRLVEDRKYGIRDLTPGARSIYGEKLTHSYAYECHNAAFQGPFEPKAKAGWLSFNRISQQWEISPCAFSRIETRELSKLPATGQWEKLIAGHIDQSGNTRPKKKHPSAVEKYQWWQARSKLQIKFNAGPLKDHGPGVHGTIRGKQKYLRYRKASHLGSGKQTGHLVFTGQPGPNKHLEFIFFDDSSSPKPVLSVSDSVYRGFRQIYQDDPKSAAAKTYAYLKKEDIAGKGIPVFYLIDSKGNVTSLGLALMYHLPYNHSIGELIGKRSSDHQTNGQYDLAELIFGMIDETDGKKSLKGRVSFSCARSEKKKEDVNTKPYTTILNSPKPTYYPNYICQDETQGNLNGDTYKTYMDSDAKIRGWKRYPVRPFQKENVQTPEANQSEDVKVTLNPVSDPVIYKGKIRFHNLKKEELGALLWALTWGDNPDLRHAVGMGKSFGFGQVAIRISEADSEIIANRPGAAVPTHKEYMNAFTTLMENWYSKVLPGSWSSSDQLLQLQAMADPDKAPGLPGELKHMSLNGGGRTNEFTLAKGAQRNRKLALMPYVNSKQSSTAHVGVNHRSTPQTPAERWLQENLEGLSKQYNTPEKLVLLGRLMANKWNEIEETSLKADVLMLIKSYWEQHGGWEEPHSGRARKAAYKIYTA